jgi:hypothetical protein
VYLIYHLGTSPEKRAEDGATLETSRMSSTRTNTSRKLPKVRPLRPCQWRVPRRPSPQLK